MGIMENGAKGMVCGLVGGARLMGCIIWGDNCRFGPPLPGEPDTAPAAMLCRSECIMS